MNNDFISWLCTCYTEKKVCVSLSVI